jgi:hypothetical protein
MNCPKRLFCFSASEQDGAADREGDGGEAVSRAFRVALPRSSLPRQEGVRGQLWRLFQRRGIRVDRIRIGEFLEHLSTFAIDSFFLVYVSEESVLLSKK